MTNPFRFLLLVLSLTLLFGGLYLAAAPIAIITGGADLQINGQLVPTTGAPNWPLSKGDEVLTGNDTAVISFPNGAKVTLAPHTKVRFQPCESCGRNTGENGHNPPEVTVKLEQCDFCGSHAANTNPNAPGTEVTLQRCEHCVVQLFQGSLDFLKPLDSKLEFCALGYPVRPDPGTQGTILIENQDTVVVMIADTKKVVTHGSCPCRAGAPWGAAGMSSAKKAAIVVGVIGGATGAVIGGTSSGGAPTPTPTPITAPTPLVNPTPIS